MRHISEGQLRAYADRALPPHEHERVQTHLGSCPRCADTLEELRLRRTRIEAWMESLDPAAQSAEWRSPAPMSVETLREKVNQQEEVGMFGSQKKSLSQRFSPAWIAVIVVLVVGLSLTLSPVRALAGNLLGLFRVQKIEVVAFDPTAVLEDGSAEAAMRSLEQMMDEQVTVDVDGELQVVDEATLRSLNSMPVRLPQAAEGEPHYLIQPGGRVTTQIDLPRIRALLGELGFADIELPASLDGATVSVELEPSAVAAYGACDPDPQERAGAYSPADFDGACTSLMQMRSPVVSAPDDLDLQQLGRAYLQLLGMEADEAARFSEQVDWTMTLIVPVPKGEVAYEDVAVDGVTGVLMRPTERRRPQSEYFLMWVKDDIIHGLMGEGNTSEALKVANSLQ